MKLSKTPPINQACRWIDFLSSFSSFLSRPALLDCEAPDVSHCETYVAQVLKGGFDPHLANVDFILQPFFF